MPRRVHALMQDANDQACSGLNHAEIDHVSRSLYLAGTAGSCMTDVKAEESALEALLIPNKTPCRIVCSLLHGRGQKCRIAIPRTVAPAFCANRKYLFEIRKRGSGKPELAHRRRRGVDAVFARSFMKPSSSASLTSM